MLELKIQQPIFIGLKVDSDLRRHIESLSDVDKKYVSSDDSTFLRLCRVGEDLYVGKLIHETLTTDRVDDISRNVLSIIRKFGHTMRLPTRLKILACSAAEVDDLSTADPPRSPRSAPGAPVRRAAV